MSSEQPNGGREPYGALREASKYAFYSLLVDLIGTFTILVLAVVALGLAALAGVSRSFSGGELAAIGVGTIIAVIILTVAFMVVELYLMLKAGRILKEYVESGGRGAGELEIPAKILYYSALAGLVGVATLIVVVGVIILVVAVLGIILGTLMLGLQLGRLHDRLSKPGLLIAIGQGLRLVSLVLFSPLMLLGIAVSLVGFYTLNREAASLAEELEGRDGATTATIP